MGASLWWLRYWGIVGVALAFTAAYALVFLMSTWWVSRHLVRLPVHSLLARCLAGPWISASVCGAAGWFWLKPLIHNLASVAIVSVLSYAVYLGLSARIAYNRDERRRGWALGRAVFGGAAEPLAVAGGQR